MIFNYEGDDMGGRPLLLFYWEGRPPPVRAPMVEGNLGQTVFQADRGPSEAERGPFQTDRRSSQTPNGAVENGRGPFRLNEGPLMNRTRDRGPYLAEIGPLR